MRRRLFVPGMVRWVGGWVYLEAHQCLPTFLSTSEDALKSEISNTPTIRTTHKLLGLAFRLELQRHRGFCRDNEACDK